METSQFVYNTDIKAKMFVITQNNLSCPFLEKLEVNL